LLRCTTEVHFDRVFYKFRENEFEKVERLIEMHKYYTQKLGDFDILNMHALSDDQVGFFAKIIFV
jgi:uncharacterized protein YozE (UPF0346 family)